MVNQSVHTAYLNEKATTYDERRFSQLSGQVVHNIELEMLNKVLPNLSQGATILEVGCGTGRFLVEMAKKGYKIDGTDASPDMLLIAKNKVGEFVNNFQPLLGEASKLPYPSNGFDLTYCVRLLNQTESSHYALSVIDDMFRVTRENGYVLVEFMNYYRAPIRTRGAHHVLLRPQEVIDRAKACRGVSIWCEGAFFLNMGIFHMTPAPLLGGIGWIDRLMRNLLPRLCTRSYILFQKQSNHDFRV
ncbi:MAG TPA: class I SAM-dependent methyltransferase [Cyclobacteriaceae bacterium]|nr:class I SAM-dependent methyltransferase [Cyclobacteriaceae bacterium]